MRILFTYSILKSLEKYYISQEFIIKHFKNTYLGSNKCVKISKIEGIFEIYKSYITGSHRMISFVTLDSDLIIPFYIGDKGDILAKNITKQTITKIIDFQFSSIQREIDEGKFSTLFIS